MSLAKLATVEFGCCSFSKNDLNPQYPALPSYRAAVEEYKSAVLIQIDSKYEASRDRMEMKIQIVLQHRIGYADTNKAGANP